MAVEGDRERPRPYVTETGGERALQFDELTVQSVMAVDEPDRLLLDYTRAMMGFLLFAPAPRHVAMIGLGGGSLAKYCLRSLPHAAFTAVEIDPDVIALRASFGIPPDDARFRVVCADGADYVRRRQEQPDVLLVDGFAAAGLPTQLGTADFYADCEAMLAPGGLLVVNHWTADPRYTLYATRLRSCFDERVVVIGAEDGDNRITFASKSPRFPPPRGQFLSLGRRHAERHSADLLEIAQRIVRALDRRRGRRPAAWDEDRVPGGRPDLGLD